MYSIMKGIEKRNIHLILELSIYNVYLKILQMIKNKIYC